ncbi:MSHA biogenesis protein MshP, partial [Vibrio splendidus]
MSRKSTQKGSALIMVIFVIVVLGFLATSLSRTSWSDNDSNTRVVLGTQAWLLSHSVNEYVMTQFYP